MSTLEDRLAEEIERVGGIMQVASKIGVDRNTIRNWINNGTITSKRLQELGAKMKIDLQYVVLELRSPKEPVQSGVVLHTEEVLTPDEAILLDNYRHCPPDGKAALKTTSAALAQPKCGKKAG